MVRALQAIGEAAKIAGEALRSAGPMIRIAADSAVTGLILDWIGIPDSATTGDWP